MISFFKTTNDEPEAAGDVARIAATHHLVLPTKRPQRSSLDWLAKCCRIVVSCEAERWHYASRGAKLGRKARRRPPETELALHVVAAIGSAPWTVAARVVGERGEPLLAWCARLIAQFLKCSVSMLIKINLSFHQLQEFKQHS